VRCCQFWARLASLLPVRWTGDVLSSLIPETISGGFAVDHKLDWRVLSFTLGLSVLSVLLFGLRPAVAALKPGLDLALRGGGASILRGSRMRGLFLLAQVASAMLGLIVAGLFVRSLVRLERQSLGVDISRLLIAELSPPEDTASPARRSEYYFQMQQHVLSLPGVRSVSLVSGIPLGIENEAVTMQVPGQGQIQTLRSDVDLQYFSTMGIPFVRGRDFKFEDANAVIVHSAAQRVVHLSRIQKRVR